MPAQGPGERPVVVKRGRRIVKAKRKPQKFVPYKPAPSSGQPGSRGAAPPLRTPALRPDDKSDAERHRAERFKRTKTYERSIRAGYGGATLPERQRQVRRITEQGPRSPEQRIVLGEHRRRMERLRELREARAQHDVPTDADSHASTSSAAQARRSATAPPGGIARTARLEPARSATRRSRITCTPPT
jgi:hypothetical protein